MEPESRTSTGLEGTAETWQTTENGLSNPLPHHQLSPCAYGDDEPLIPEDWIKDVAEIHPASDNWVCIASAKDGNWSHSWCMAKAVIPMLSKLSRTADFLKRNIYVSQLEFSERKRTVNSVAAMNVSFLDLDGKLAKNQTPEEWREAVLEHCRRYSIPEPNDMVFSGNGIHVKWIYTQPASRSQLERWSHIERLLFVQFETLGADAKALDAARVLRVPGTFNCKPGTKDNRVRVIHHSPAAYTFDEFAAKIEDSIPVNPESFKACMEEWEKSGKSKKPEPEIEFQFCPIADDELKRLQDTARRLDAACISRSFVVLSRCPGATVDEKIENIRQHCREYRDVGIPEPNQYITVGDTVIAEWGYDAIPIYASSRWEATQEFLCRHFERYGAMDNPDNLKFNASLPVPDVKAADGAITRIPNPSEPRYSFNKLAKAVLNFSQQEVRAYKAKKAEEKAEKRVETKQRKPRLYPNGDFKRIARARYHDISNLLAMRKDVSGNVRQGCREKCVFWAMNFAIQAEEVTSENFDSHAQSIIDFCGPRFRSECGVRVLTTLKRKLEKGDKTYFATDMKLIKELEITEEEQREMLTLMADKPKKEKKERTPRAQWLEAHPQERTAPWKKMGISRSTYFERKKAAREVTEAEQRRRDENQRWMEALRQRMIQLIEARQKAEHITLNILSHRVSSFVMVGQVLPYIMRERCRYIYKSKYRGSIVFVSRVRGP